MPGKKKSAATPRELTQADYRLLAEFRYLLRRFLVFSEAAARGAGLSPQQHQTLLAMKGFEGEKPPTVGDLAERMAIKHNSMVGQIDRLARAGLVTRHADKADGRRITLTLTVAANNILMRLTAAHRDELKRLMPLLKPLLDRLEQY